MRILIYIKKWNAARMVPNRCKYLIQRKNLES